MKRILLIVCIYSSFLSCTYDKDKIEIYLLKERIRSIEGIPLLEYAKLENYPLIQEITSIEKANFDTIKKQIIYGGEFRVSKEHINKLPLIQDTEIIKFDSTTNELIISTSGRKKIENLKPNMKFGTQFVICINGEPSLTGYFRNHFSSYIYNWNYIHYKHPKDNFQTPNVDKFIINQNVGYVKWNPIIPNMNEYPKLIQAFQSTNRLIN